MDHKWHFTQEGNDGFLLSLLADSTKESKNVILLFIVSFKPDGP